MEIPDNFLSELIEDKDKEKEILLLETKMFNPFRMLILKYIYKHLMATFSELKDILEIPDGNLSSHLKSLIDINLLAKEPMLFDDKKITIYGLTENGKEVYVEFMRVARRFFND